MMLTPVARLTDARLPGAMAACPEDGQQHPDGAQRAAEEGVDWDVIDRMPCAVTLLPVPKTSMSFYDFDAYERLVLAASALDATAHLIVLLGGEADLRCGEMIALEWRDVDLGKRDAALPAPESSGRGQRDSAAGSARHLAQWFWRHFGDGEGLRRKDQWIEQLS